MSENKETVEFEECVLCHAMTEVQKSSSVENREYYVDGVGQLCGKCFGSVAATANEGSRMTNSQLNSIMRSCLKSDDENEYKSPSAYIKNC